MTDTKPPSIDADEKAVLVSFLDYLRSAIAAKAEGVPEPEVRAAGVPSGTSLLGLVKHLTYVEKRWFLGEDVEDWAQTMQPSQADTAEGVIAEYRAVTAQANRVIDSCTDLAVPAVRSSRRTPSPSLRWTLVHMIEETGRHTGHADIIREQIDGATGR